MKKNYGKPEIFFENFSLSTSIAGNCDYDVDLPVQFACGVPDENGQGKKIFTSGDCTVMGNDMTTWNGLCYHVPDAGNRLFNS